MMKPLKCDKCRANEVSEVTDQRLSVWRCSACASWRYWAPCCDQGWVLHLQDREIGDLYVCDECESCWRSVCDVASGPADALHRIVPQERMATFWPEAKRVYDLGAPPAAGHQEAG
jgi:hypothetical protein